MRERKAAQAGDPGGSPPESHLPKKSAVRCHCRRVSLGTSQRNPQTSKLEKSIETFTATGARESEGGRLPRTQSVSVGTGWVVSR